MKTKNLLLTIVLFLFSSAQAQSQELVWADEFDYTGLPNSEKWSYDVGGGGWGNNELQYYTDARSQNAYVENGKLTITAIKESYSGKNYTSARLITKYKGDWKYGRVEVRAKLPSGRGSWPAIWMLPTNWEYGGWPASGEIDIMEYVGYDPQIIHGSVHTEDYNHSIGTQITESITVSDAETAFHVYAMDWSEDKIDIYVDDTKYFTFTSSTEWQKWPFDKTFHLLLNIAVGGDWGGAQGVDNAIFPIKMEVDYVRVYQDAVAITIKGDDFVEKNQQSVNYTVGNIIGATYLWNVPADVEIISGQNTNSITVNWGETDGEISLSLTRNENTETYNKIIKTVHTPPEDGTILNTFDDGLINDISTPTDADNTFVFTEENGNLKVAYDIQNSSAPPYFELEFERPINMTNHPEFSFDLKTLNESASVILRADLVDIEGRITDISPVFNISEINSDGNFHNYSNDFSESWKTSNPYGGTVDKSKIKKVIFYVNFGFFGQDNKQDEFWIDNIKVSEATTGIKISDFDNNLFKIYPNPVKDKLYVTISKNAINKPLEIKLFSIEGKLIETISTKNNSAKININDYKTGNYILQLKYNGKLYSKKIMKE